MVKKWKKLVDKIVKSGSRLDLADGVDNIINEINIENYDIIPLKGVKDQYRARVGDYRIIFEKCKTGNKIIKIDKRGDIY